MSYSATETKTFEPTPLDHNLQPFLEELIAFSSTPEMEASALYQRLRPEVERVLNGLVEENWSRASAESYGDELRPVRVTAWNIERGTRLESIIQVLKEHPSIRESDLLLLTELDYGMARSGNRFVAREIARELRMNYAFAPCYLSLVKGSGLESNTEGDNTQALHGNALFSRYPITGAHQLALPNGKDKMRGKEKRLGAQRAVIADVMHPLGAFRAVSLHLDAHSTQRHRHLQMKLLLDHLESLTPQLPVIIGGDWNTSTYNSRRAIYSIMGFWRRVMMGVGYFIRTHYPYPDRWFERGLFRELERRGYDYRSLNEPGVGTLHYSVDDIAVNTNMADWIPEWCFHFLRWSLRNHGGRASLKLDWFAGRGLTPAPDYKPRVIGDLLDESGRLSDHDAIVLEFVPSNENS
ncbi:MAG: endonuclease/exonuclease/phosphatase family protein [Pyrinomonadaceae bacterium]|nr:endonuclease/exonuclease/phosphatase family protein [Pyrinomonadaceae bacterium]